MSDNSKIEWTDTTWNPTTGCDKVSPGCDNCYAERLHERFHGKGSFGLITHYDDRLGAPFRWRRPRRVFVNSMSDLLHDYVPDAFIARVWSVMMRTPQHTYQVLTKRHGRLRSLLGNPQFRARVAAMAGEDAPIGGIVQWPLPNVWLGVSVEDQHWADIRIPALLDTPAAVRFISAEPLLGPVDLDRWLYLVSGSTAGPFRDHAGRVRVRGGGAGGQTMTSIPSGDLSWVIIGGESGPGARPLRTGWVHDLVQQCQAAGVAPFVKQLGKVWAWDTWYGGRRVSSVDRKGGDPQYWPAALRVREYPQVRTEVGV